MRLEQIVVFLEPVSILRALITRGPATVGCDDEQGDTFYSAEQHGKTALVSTSAVKSRAGTWIKNRQTDRQTNRQNKNLNVNRSGRSKLGVMRNPWQWSKHARLYSHQLHSENRRPFTAVVSHCRITEDTYDCLNLFHCSCLDWSMSMIQCTSLTG